MSPRNETPIERKDAVATNLVRVTQEPGVVREVDDRELIDLQRQGVLHSFEHTEHTLDVLPKGYKAENRWKAADKVADIVTAPDPTTATNVGTTDTDNTKGV